MVNDNDFVRPAPEMTPDVLALWRRHHRVSQEQLAAALGVRRHTIARWETEERRMPGRWLYVALQGLEQQPELWQCAKCGHDGLDQIEQDMKVQGARQTLFHFVCPDCNSIAYLG